MILHIILSLFISGCSWVILSCLSENLKWLSVFVFVAYFLLAPYSHEENIRNCQTKKGDTVSLVVVFDTPIVKFIFEKPTNVRAISINNQKCIIPFNESPSKQVFNGTVFEGHYNNDTLLLIL